MSEVHYDDCVIKKVQEMFGGVPAFMGCGCHRHTVAALEQTIQDLRSEVDKLKGYRRKCPWCYWAKEGDVS